MTNEPGRRDPVETIAVWEKHSRTFATAAIVCLAFGVMTTRGPHPGVLPVAALLACVLSVGIVVTGRLIVRRTRQELPRPSGSEAE